jgi:TRAP-type C4-dicarboxylate transport system permease small subunit
MRRIQQLEGALIRVESRIVVVVVLVMLLLAVYNVVYRNVLVSLQRQLATSGPPVVTKEPAPAVEPDRAAQDDAEGFGGGLADADDTADDAEGFGGGLADADDTGDRAAAAAEPVAQEKALEPESAKPEGGPPPPGSFAARGVAFIDAIKLEWIDVFLRQLVLIVSFFGAMLATHRRKHINIDAVGTILPKKLRRPVAIAVNVLAVLICIVLAAAGLDLVEIGVQYPKDVVPWAREWAFQLVFPLGFGLLALHFAVRLLEAMTDPQAEKAGTP